VVELSNLSEFFCPFDVEANRPARGTFCPFAWFGPTSCMDQRWRSGISGSIRVGKGFLDHHEGKDGKGIEGIKMVRYPISIYTIDVVETLFYHIRPYSPNLNISISSCVPGTSILDFLRL
jgi:hypothetical protein